MSGDEIEIIGYEDGYRGIKHPTEFRFPYYEQKETVSSRYYKLGWIEGMVDWINDHFHGDCGCSHYKN